MLIKQTHNVTRARRRVNITTLVIAAAAPFVFAASAHAQSGDKTVEVVFAASELATEDGLVRIYDTMQRTAETACEDNNRRLGIHAKRADERCIDNLVEDFVLDVSHPGLTALHGASHVIVE